MADGLMDKLTLSTVVGEFDYLFIPNPFCNIPREMKLLLFDPGGF
jgi:hypothetical protein